MRPSECLLCRDLWEADPLMQKEVRETFRTQGKAAAYDDLNNRLEEAHVPHELDPVIDKIVKGLVR